jgi:hypothetical protein
MPYNNFIYKINLAFPIAQATFKMSRQSFTEPPTDGTTTIIFRTSNPRAVGVNSNNWIENEVAALFLCRQAVSSMLPGVPLDSKFGDLPFTEKKELLSEIAGIFAVVQKISLSEGVTSFGGFTINDGNIESCQSTIALGGLWNSYHGWWTGFYAMSLSQAENSPVSRCWTDNGVKERVYKFIGNDIESMLQEVDTSKLFLVHGDFSKHCHS